MATSHKTHNIPQKENLTLWYDMSSPACINPEGLFEEDLTTYQKRKDAFGKHMGVLVDQGGGNSNYLRNSSRGIYQFGYKDLSGNGHHMALAYTGNPTEAHDTKTKSYWTTDTGYNGASLWTKPYQRVILPLLDKGQGWHFNFGDHVKEEGQYNNIFGAYTGSNESDATRGLMWPGQNFLNGTYTPVGPTVTASNYAPDANATDREYLNAARTNPFKDEALDGPTFARITHTSRYPNSVYSQTDWEVFIAGENVKRITPNPSDMNDTTLPVTSLKPGMIVSRDDIGDWEVGPPIMASACFWDKSGHYEEESTYTVDENIDNHFAVTPGTTWHPLRPIKGNKREIEIGVSASSNINNPLGTFKRNELGIDVLGRAKTPIRKREGSRVANRTYIYRDLTVKFDEDAPNISGGGLSPYYTADVNTIYVNYGTGASNAWNSQYQAYGIEGIDIHPELVADLRDNVGGNASNAGNYSPTSTDGCSLYLYDEYGHEVLEGFFKLNKGSGGTYQSVFQGDRESFIRMRPWSTPRSLLPITASHQKGTAEWYGSRKFTMVIVIKPYAINMDGNNGLDWTVSHSSHFPVVEYDNYGKSDVPGFFPARKNQDDIDQLHPSLQHGAICDSLYWDSSAQRRSYALTCNLWVRMPENPYSYEVAGDAGQQGDVSYRQVTPLIDFGCWGLFIKSSDVNGSKRQLVFRNRKGGQNNIKTVSGGALDDFFEPTTGNSYFTDWVSEHLDQLVTHRQWFQVSVTFSTSGAAVKLYINGEELSGVTINNNGGPYYQYIGHNDVNRPDGIYNTSYIYTKHGYLGHTSHTGNNFRTTQWGQAIYYRHYTDASQKDKGVSADMDFGVVQIWRASTLNASEIKQLFNIYARRFNRSEIDDYVIDPLDDLCRRTASGEGVPVQKDMRHPPHNITQRVSSFTSSTSVKTVRDAINAWDPDAHWQGYGATSGPSSAYTYESVQRYGWNNISFQCFAVAELGKVSTNLPATTSNNIYTPDEPMLLWDQDSTDPSRNTAYFRGSHFWGDPELNGGAYDTPYPYIGIACFDKTGYLGATFMLFKCEDTRGEDTIRYDSQFKSFRSSYADNDFLYKLFTSTGTNLTTSTTYPTSKSNLYQIEGYTHDVSGYYEVNGKPSSIDNPYIVKTTSSGENSTQSWNYTINSGNISTSNPLFYSSTYSGQRSSQNGGVFGWKPGENVYGYRPYAVNDIWGIANWTGDDTDSVASWGPNKTFTADDEPRFYIFYQWGKNRKW